MTESELRTYVAQLSPHIDRLFMDGHRSARPYAPAIREWLGIPRFGVLIDLRKLLLAPGGMRLAEALAMERYADPAQVETTLSEHVAQGMLERRGGSFFPTARGREGLLRLTDALAQGLEGVWILDGRFVTETAGLSEHVIARGRELLPPDRYPAFTAESAGYLPPAPSPPFRLWSALATLRYLRADAHALAWAEEGLASGEIAALTELWRREDRLRDAESARYSAVLPELLRRGWALRDAGGWRISESGRASRAAIEDRTNGYNAAPFDVLSAEQRRDLLGRLSTLRTPAEI